MNLYKRAVAQHGFREGFAKENFLFAKNGRVQKKKFRSSTIYERYSICEKAPEKVPAEFR